MDYLWSPWRYQYLTAEKPPVSNCIFCDMAADNQDRKNLIVHRGKTAFLVLNRYPYTNGHVMVVPYQHAADLSELDETATAELMSLSRVATGYIRDLYNPDGLNLGMNLGEAEGAGVAGHLHMHVLPRWRGDANFMTTIGETRILPEELDVSWKKFRDAFQSKR